MSVPFTIGVAGHVDHGKTTLVRTLTGIDTDRKAEEKTRGLSIESGVAELKLPDGQSVALIDVPGHTDFLKNTIRGLYAVDLAVLVVAVDDGVMPQTREHLEILNYFETSTGLVVLTKTDLVDEETIEIAELEINELLSNTFLDQCPVFRFSDKQPDLCAGIIQGIGKALADLSARKPGPAFRLWIDQVKSIPGHGTVVTGTVASGSLDCNDEIELLPSGTRIRARSLELHGSAVARAVAGQRVGVNLHRVPLDHVGRGMSLATPEAIRPTYMLNAELHLLAASRIGIKNRQRVRLYLGTSIANAMIVLMEGERLDPGQTGLVQIRLMRPVAALPRDAFVISPLNMNTVLGGGRVLETPRQKYRTVKSAIFLPRLTALRKADADTYLETMFEQMQGTLINARHLSAQTGLPPAAFERTITSKVQKGELVYIKGHGAIKQNHLTAIERQFMAFITEAFKKDPMKKNVALSEAAEHLDQRVEEDLLKITADALCRAGRIVRLGGGYRPADLQALEDKHHEQSVSFLLEYMQSAGLTPISPGFFRKHHPSQYTKTQAVRLFNYLHSQKKLVRLKDDRFLSLSALEEIKHRVARAISEKGFITLYDCKELLGYGRSGGAHVLDYLNHIGFTVRQGDRHYLGKDVP